MKLYLSLLMVLLFGFTQAQTFENIRALRDEDRIIIFYDLISLNAGSTVDVRLFSSLDNFSTPLVNNVSGDIGKISPGPNKRITWVAGNEIASKVSSIRFDLKGEITIGLSFISPKPNGKLKAGKNYTIKWQGGSANGHVSLEVVTPNHETIAIANTNNSGSYELNVPKNFKPGNRYTLRLVSGSDVIEQPFVIKRKVALLWYALPVVAVAAVLISSGGGNSGGEIDLPDAPLPN